VTTPQDYAQTWARGHHRTRGRWLPALLIAAALAGCGSSSKETTTASTPATTTAASTSTPPPTTTASTTTAQTVPTGGVFPTAEVICARLNTAIAGEHTTVKGLAELAASAARIGLLEKAALNELTKLAAPSTIAPEWRKVLLYRRILAENFGKLHVDAEHSEIKKFGALNASSRAAQAKLGAIATHAGLKACAQAG
jgi:hypothetical protein